MTAGLSSGTSAGAPAPQPVPSISASRAPAKPTESAPGLCTLLDRAEMAARRLECDLSRLEGESSRAAAHVGELHECLRLGAQMLQALMRECERIESVRNASG
ncbi:MAG: hypothetical protein KDA22_13930 [Phycisphaerales bacterium]|nr:hypothetical protein [Phycisphaerales bacterium]